MSGARSPTGAGAGAASAGAEAEQSRGAERGGAGPTARSGSPASPRAEQAVFARTTA